MIVSLELKRTSKEVGVTYFEALSSGLYGVTKKYYETFLSGYDSCFHSRASNLELLD
jgi:hypothetical protein